MSAGRGNDADAPTSARSGPEEAAKERDRKPRRPISGLERTLAAEQGRYSEALRDIARTVRDEFSTFSSTPFEDLRGKLDVLDSAIGQMSELSERIERLRMVAQAARKCIHSDDPGERERALRALLAALEEVDRIVPDRSSRRLSVDRPVGGHVSLGLGQAP